jgi:hypothetical protein
VRYIEAPEPYDGPGPVLFLAGGISNCPDWQADAAAMLSDQDDLTVLNPRRAAFTEDTAVEQIIWEHTHLHRADVILFWFTDGSLQPIALYELGVHATLGVPLAVGADPAYPRRLDVEVQLSLARPALTIHRTLAETVASAQELTSSVRGQAGRRPGP